MMLTNLQRKTLKAQAHHLNPVIMIGAKGLTPQVVLETDRALETHELIKVKIHVADRSIRKTIALDLSKQCHAEFIQIIGQIAIIYRKKI
ncbi:MAG: ribosome assembly RNA-binding protein YhbY [Gammaproteobacteria bacterium]